MRRAKIARSLKQSALIRSYQSALLLAKRSRGILGTFSPRYGEKRSPQDEIENLTAHKKCTHAMYTRTRMFRIPDNGLGSHARILRRQRAKFGTAAHIRAMKQNGLGK